MSKRAKQPEVKLTEKVFDFINTLFPNEIKKASKEFQKSPEAQMAQDKETFSRGLFSYFLVQRPIKGATPMEYALSLPMDYFSSEEKRIIMNFTRHVWSMFEIMHVSDDKKDYTIRDMTDGRKYLVKTIDFPAREEHDHLLATIVRKRKNEWFFHGNVLTYSKEDAEAISAHFAKDLEGIRLKETPDIEWDIKYK